MLVVAGSHEQGRAAQNLGDLARATLHLRRGHTMLSLMYVRAPARVRCGDIMFVAVARTHRSCASYHVVCHSSPPRRRRRAARVCVGSWGATSPVAVQVGEFVSLLSQLAQQRASNPPPAAAEAAGGVDAAATSNTAGDNSGAAGDQTSAKGKKARKRRSRKKGKGGKT